MKRINKFYFIFTIFVAVMFTIVSCTKEGPAGPAGADGTNGENGIDGKDGTAAGVQCHDKSQVNFAKLRSMSYKPGFPGKNGCWHTRNSC